MRHPNEILFVDDQWCQVKERDVIVAAYGALTRREPPYVFEYSTAELGPGTYAVEPVLTLAASMSNLAAVVLDIMFGDRGDRFGLDILAALRSRFPLLPIFMLTSLDDEIEAVERAMELGANEYLIKKPTLEELERLLETYVRGAPSDQALWGNSMPIRRVRALIARVAAGGTASVLITGESGTGKELVARAIHRQGPRRRASFVATNCAHEESELLDSMLFGHERGAFTGADRQHIGLIERANGGVLFLDEIGSISAKLQAKLLRVLETREFERLGGREMLRSDFQLISATNEDVAQRVAEGHLREDLLYRIRQFDIHVPPLRERQDDVPLLADLFLRRFRESAGASYRGQRFSGSAIELLQHYRWPGNVRELKNLVERAVILSRGPVMEDDLFVTHIREDIKDRQTTNGTASGDISALPVDPVLWPRYRLFCELRMAAEAKRRSRSVAEFMRRLYPYQRKSSTAALAELIRRLTTGPWGDPVILQDPELKQLIDELQQ